MGLSNSPQSYPDVRDLLDRVLESPLGLRVTFSSRGKLVNFKQRCYKYRLLDRKASESIYPSGDARRGTSAYDVIYITDEENVLTLRAGSIEHLLVEEIT